MKRRTRSSAPEPLPRKEEDEDEKDNPRKNWQLVPAASSSAARFGLPDGWCVEEIPRCSHPERLDRYFIEPDTGLRFRSLVAVRRYLSGGQVAKQATVRKQGTVGKQATVVKQPTLDKQATVDRQAILYKQATMQITPHTARCSPSFVLPDGWKIVKKPRKNTWNTDSDKFYIEPGTGRRFRSLVAVERYLAEENEHAPLQVSSGSSGQKKKIPSLKIVSKNSSHANDCNTFNASSLNTYTSHAEHFSSSKKTFHPKNSRTSQLNNSSQPPKVKWFLADHLKNEWYPFMDDSMVAESVKQKWSEIFKSTIYGETIRPAFF